MITKLASVTRAALLAALAVCPLACDSESTAPAPDQSIAAAKLVGGSLEITGDIGTGALYGLYRPAGWNGELVLFSRGWTSPAAPVALPTYAAPLRDALLAAGYGFAWSSWSENGMDVKDAAIRVGQLKNLFASKIGRPERTYLLGHSLGAAVVMHIAEQNPQQYDGVITNSGIIGGLPYQLDNYFNIRALFDYYYPGVLPGEPGSLPEGVTFPQAAIFAAIAANPTGAYEMASIAQTKMAVNSLLELQTWVATGLNFGTMAAFAGEIRQRTHDRPFFDNLTTVYSGSSDDEALNANVNRYGAATDAHNLLEHWYSPTGKLQIPLIALAARRDFVVPLRHVELYESLVAQQGASEFFLKRVSDLFTHGLSVSAQVQAVQDLSNWVATGIKPAS